MNWEKLFEIQAGLDQHIIDSKGLQGQDLLDKKILALQVELGELANEQRTWKFWSNDQEPRTKVYYSDYIVLPGGREIEKVTNPLLEEYVDCLHFILSIGNDIGINHYHFESYPQLNGDMSKQFINIFSSAGSIAYANQIKELTEYGSDGLLIEFNDLMNELLGLGEMLGFTEVQIEQAYMIKNVENHKRQKNGY